MEQSKQARGGQIKQFAEKAGIYIFFISWVLYTQIKWMKRHNGLGELEIRLLLGFFAGMLLAFAITKLIAKIANKADKDYEVFLNKLSLALSPGILFIFASAKEVFLTVGAVLCIVTALYIWANPFRSFMKYIIKLIYGDKFKNILLVENNKALLSIKGTYEKANPDALQSFLIDLVINLNECSELGISEIKIDFSGLKGEGEPGLKSIIEPVAQYFNLKTRH